MFELKAAVEVQFGGKVLVRFWAFNTPPRPGDHIQVEFDPPIEFEVEYIVHTKGAVKSTQTLVRCGRMWPVETTTTVADFQALGWWVRA